uniref:Condensin-2 complex subunit H2 n=1 Tax=Oryctolagus cuniculus TaxID=9986 RepID=A0A5F9C7T6_RABIT
MSEDIEARFAHLLQPIRDLTKNWEVDVAAQLAEYLEEVRAAGEWRGAATRTGGRRRPRCLRVRGRARPQACCDAPPPPFLCQCTRSCYCWELWNRFGRRRPPSGGRRREGCGVLGVLCLGRVACRDPAASPALGS